MPASVRDSPLAPPDATLRAASLAGGRRRHGCNGVPVGVCRPRADIRPHRDGWRTTSTPVGAGGLAAATARTAADR